MSDPVLIQPVESPVICKPYYEPTHYWEYDRGYGHGDQTGRAGGPHRTGTSLPRADIPAGAVESHAGGRQADLRARQQAPGGCEEMAGREMGRARQT